MASSIHVRLHECYENWMIQQQDNLDELLQVFNQNPNDQQKLHLIIDKTLNHFQDYNDKRSQLTEEEEEADADMLFSPTWCTSIENSCLWLGGCRPSLAIRLVYWMSGSQLESQLSEFLEGIRKGNMGELSATQLGLISDLQCRTVKEEDKLSEKMTSLQENIADYPLTAAATATTSKSDDSSSELNEKVDRILDSHAKALGSLLVESDRLRMTTLKEVMVILTPLQAVDYLIALKKLHLCIHEAGQRRDLRSGRTA